MAENVQLYRMGISFAGAVLIGLLGLLLGFAWSIGTGAGAWLIVLVAGLAALWGAIVVQLTPTGGVIMENRTTVNYAVLALHGWYTVFLSAPALIVLAARTWLL